MQAYGISFWTYNFSRLSHPAGVYVKMAAARHVSYIGMFSKTMLNREASRCRKFRQVVLVNVEPALRWWSRNRSFYGFVPIVLRLCSSKREALVLETLDQQEMKPELNVPRVWSKLGRKRKLKLNSLVQRPLARRLFARARRLMRGESWLSRVPQNSLQTPHAQVFAHLHFLGEKTANTFEFEKQLRSHSTSAIEIYMLLRASNCLEEPKRGVAKSRIKSVMKFRDMIVPTSAQPLSLGALAHDSFRAHSKSFVKSLLQKHPEACIPLHIPEVGYVETKWRNLQDSLWGFKDFRSRPKSMLRHCECVCARFRTILPSEAWSADGHVAMRGYLATDLSKYAHAAAASNSKETIFPSFDQFTVAVKRAVGEFWQSNHICAEPWEGKSGLEARAVKWARAEFRLHQIAARSKQFVCASHVEEIKSKYGDLVWHCEDHRYTRLVGFCPSCTAGYCMQHFLKPQMCSGLNALHPVKRCAW